MGQLNNSGEQLLSDIISVLYDNDPSMDVEITKSKLSTVMSKYHMVLLDEDEPHPDIKDKIELYLSAKKIEGLKPDTLRNYRLDLNSFANKVKRKVEDITAADIRAYLAEFNHLKLSSLGRKLNSIRSFFVWLTGEEFIQRDPTLKIKSPKLEKLMPKALTIEELEMMRESCKTPRQRAFVEVLYATGARLSEVQRLNKSDINYQTMSCKVYGKGSKEREVYFSFKAMYHLKKYLNSRTDKNEALIVSQRKPHSRLSNRGIQREIAVIAKNAGFEKSVSPHDLRRTFGMLTLNNGAELVAVQELLGHSSPDTTLRYARITEERKREQHKKYLVQ
jgi:integrase/recombinase XerD